MSHQSQKKSHKHPQTEERNAIEHSIPNKWSDLIAKNQNTYAKRQREVEKKSKAEEKRKRRLEKADEPKQETPIIKLSDLGITSDED